MLRTVQFLFLSGLLFLVLCLIKVESTRTNSMFYDLHMKQLPMKKHIAQFKVVTMVCFPSTD